MPSVAERKVMTDFIEQKIISAIKELLSKRVNEILNEAIYKILLIEFGNYEAVNKVSPKVELTTCERTEKERILQIDTYSLTITLEIKETAESELFCYTYANAVKRAIKENPTLNGVADRAVITTSKYISPKKPNCGECWGLVMSLRITTGGC